MSTLEQRLQRPLRIYPAHLQPPMQFEPDAILPHEDATGRLIFDHSVPLTYKYSQELWKQMNARMNDELDRTRAQVVVLPFHRDVTHRLYKDLNDNPLDHFPTATHSMKHWPDGDLDIREFGLDPHAQNIYLVGSIITPQDAHIANIMALQCKTIMGAKCVTVVAPSIAGARQDKNTSRGEYNRATLNIEAVIAGLASGVDRLIVGEPHSSTAQYFAARHGIPLLPFSYWQVLTDYVLEEGVKVNGSGVVKLNPEIARVGRPDIGRNLAAMAIEKYTGFPSVCCDKTRIDAHTTQIFLSDGNKEKVRGKIVIMYDDEAATLGTVEQVLNVFSASGVLAVAFMVAYGKFVPGKDGKPGWKERINHPLLSSVVVSDARPPYDQSAWKHILRHQVTVKDTIRDLIQADIAGVDFWEDPRFAPLILQQNGEEDC